MVLKKASRGFSSNLRGQKALGLVLLATMAATMAACSSVEEGAKNAASVQSSETGERATATDGAANTSPSDAHVKVLDLTADYQKKPIDILILRENSSAMNQDYFRYRLVEERLGIDRLYQYFALQLYFSDMNFQLGFLETAFANDADAERRGGNLVQGPAGEATIMTSALPTFVDRVMNRSLLQHQQTQGNASISYNANAYYPLFALGRLLEKTDDPASVSSGFVRDEAFLSVLYVGYWDMKREATDTAEIIEMMDRVKGEGNWMISVIAPPREGCEFTHNNVTIHSNQDASAANTTDRTTYLKYKRRDKMLRLQEYSAGIFESVCAPSYKDFVRKFFSDATQNGFFTTTLPEAPTEGSLAVYVNGSPVSGWRYNTKTKVLSLPTAIKTGTPYQVAYTPQEGEGSVIVGTEDHGEGIPDIQARGKRPSELEFAATVLPILRSNNCTGCHGAYNNYQSAWNDRAQIRERINLPANDPLRMPKGAPFDSAENLRKLNDWLLLDE